MGSPYETHHVEENEHCLVCHTKNATVIHHPVGNVKAKEYGFIEVICNNKHCKAELKIPRLKNPIINSKSVSGSWF